MLRAVMASLVLMVCSECACAGVTEKLSYSFYVANAQSSSTIGGALQKASPYRQDGKVYNAFTKWYVNWHYHWTEQSDGMCRMDSVQVELDSTIHLPALANDSPAQHQRFFTYLLALQKHELGHVDLGRQASHLIEDGILALPAMRSCLKLEDTANRLANRILDEARQREIEYDVSTGHGRTQGARLD